MQPLEVSLATYAARHLPSLSNDYVWRFDPAIVQVTFGLSVTGATWYDKTRALKRGLAKTWGSAPHQQATVADYAVRIWGGVKRNAPATMSVYVQTVSQGKLPMNHKGIASWSKVAAFSDPAKYAIFDARVSLSLNAIQLLSDAKECWWFPHLTGQNSLLIATWPHLRAHAKQWDWERVASAKVYSTYIDLLKSTSARLGRDIEDVEMLLFAKAEELAREAKEARRASGRYK